MREWLDQQKAQDPNNSRLQSTRPDNLDPDEDRWAPIQIERESQEYNEAIDASEAAIREIEASNGYAATDLEERNAIIATTKGTIDAIKNGSPSKLSIRFGLLAPLKFIAKKFAETTIGEIAKIAATKLAAWLLSL